MSKCDIIIPVWNQFEDTRDCIDSVRRNTSHPYRLILIDNASEYKTKDYLDSLERVQGMNVKLIRNEKNEGFVKAVNKGISLCDAEYICILNNDTLVTTGWLGELISVFGKNPHIGIVNPSSNTLGQRLGKDETPDERARGIKIDSGSFVELGGGFAFCMLVRKKLFDEIGLFDEIYGMGYFEDADFSLRAKGKGYKTVRAIASYVYHKEKVSFNLLKSFRKDFKKNRNIFESKWGKTKRVAVILRDINNGSLDRLKNILKKHAKEKSWVYVISAPFETKEFFENFSNVTFYHYRRFLYFFALFKILFKKKRINNIYIEK